ncbi:UNVERIFIED_CONTAM: Retrovirus-related Pol polyprotein from transposon.6 [Sesamum radiatum]|uniref:Retrovirus-related Pol polyprotein from transposon.6 n=1 Tax=Sesamum radiatum TaxID=300843 RepID=A0AAW2LMJ8_SESRA
MIPIPEKLKVSLASVYMQGRAELWFQGHLEKRGMPTWSELVIIILRRFEDLDYERVVSEFNMLRHETTVHEYRIKFEELESHMLIFNKNLDESFFMMKFVSGLKEEIKGCVATMNPTTLDQAIVLARRQENMPRNDNPQPRRFLTEAEVRAKKEKNLCYKCDEPYSPGYRCRMRQVHMLLTEDEAKAYEEGEKPLRSLLSKGNHVLKGELYTVSRKEPQVEGAPRLSELILQFQDIFQEPKTLPPERAIELMHDAIPKKQHPYRYAYGQKTEIERIVKEMLDSGIIRTSQSSFASPVLLVKKKDGGWRLCVDYRYLNKLTVKHNFPIPVIDELLDELHGAKYFSKIDLRSGYFHIRMKQEDIPKTSFITYSAHYEFLVMPFGLCNAPSTFQALMNQSKCSFAQQQVDYLGHVIFVNGVSTDLQKVECMRNSPVPTTIKALRGFLGLTGYYKKFNKRYGVLSKSLTSLFKKNVFTWNPEVEAAFENLKKVMTNAHVLALPNFL